MGRPCFSHAARIDGNHKVALPRPPFETPVLESLGFLSRLTYKQRHGKFRRGAVRHENPSRHIDSRLREKRELLDTVALALGDGDRPRSQRPGQAPIADQARQDRLQLAGRSGQGRGRRKTGLLLEDEREDAVADLRMAQRTVRRAVEVFRRFGLEHRFVSDRRRPQQPPAQPVGGGQAELASPAVRIARFFGIEVVFDTKQAVARADGVRGLVEARRVLLDEHQQRRGSDGGVQVRLVDAVEGAWKQVLLRIRRAETLILPDIQGPARSRATLADHGAPDAPVERAQV